MADDRTVEVIVGRLGRPHGLRGEVSVEVRTDDPEGRLAPGAVLRTDPAAAGPLTIATGRVHGGRLMLRFEGYDDRRDAERLRGVLLVVDVDVDERPEDPEEFYDRQLVGLAVVTAGGEPVGALHEVLHLPGQDVLAVRGDDGRETLIPFVHEFVPEVDLDGGRIVVEPPPGLLDEPAAES
ncbi:MAG: rRNA processing protein RimM [Actinomycetota bacterium]|jgi:16S rRNA processing protein RimM|nr:rRNA processing protein RimM [Actinomycetota bacterium]